MKKKHIYYELYKLIILLTLRITHLPPILDQGPQPVRT